MALRPISFIIPSTTELKVTFSETLNESLTTDNFAVESLSGAVDDLEVIGITVEDRVARIKTRPQVSGNYYLLKFLDTTDIIFSNNKGIRLLSDSVSRELFFVGIDKINPIRDRMYDSVPNLFEIQNTIVGRLISAQAEELYRAQRSVGEVLSNNYISEEVIDEPRTRTSGAVDRLANENAYDISRVARRQIGTRNLFEIINYTSDNPLPRSQTLSVFPTSLQQVEVESETIDISTEENSFSGFLINLKNRNVIKLLSVRVIRDGEVADCYGDIGEDYDVERFKYSIKSNYYDQNYAFSFPQLEDNQVLLSEFGNISRPEILDTLIVSYIYKNKGRYIVEDEVEVSRVESRSNESVPTNSTRFFLDHAPIVDVDNKVMSIGGVNFRVNENSSEVPVEFTKELVFNTNALPTKLGEYSINYETGEVFLVGAIELGEGTGRNNSVVSYLYRKEFARDIDYAIYDQNIVPMPDRELSNNEAEISIRYDEVFAEGIDYRNASHIEVLPEFVENRLSSSFSITTQHAPVTNVYRILNQTTGEVYNPLFHTDTTIHFSGSRSPEIKNSGAEESAFKRTSNEELSVIGEFVVPAFRTRITSNISNNSIMFSPGIPAEFISQNSDDYFFRQLSTTDDGVAAEDISIRFFGPPDGENLITLAGISATATPPSLAIDTIIGTKAYMVYLQNEGILNKNEDSIGSIINSSAIFDDQSIFQNEKYFEPITVNPGLTDTTGGGISTAVTVNRNETFYKNISKLRRPGDYTIDYLYGIAYVAIEKEQDISIGNISYSNYELQTRNSNIYNVISAAKKTNSPEPLDEAVVLYNSLSFDNNSITIHDLENTLTVYDGETRAVDLDSQRQIVCRILEDYTVVVPNNIISINGIFELTDLTGRDLTSSSEALRQEEKTKDQLLTNVRNGGYNLYDNLSLTFEKNVIDFKKKASRRGISDGTNYVITIQDATATTFVQAKQISTDQVVFDDKLNIVKLGDLSVAAVVPGAGTATVSIESGPALSGIDTSGDYLLDVNGDRFVITAVDPVMSTIEVTTPAENNVTATQPAVDASGSTAVVVKPTVTFSSGNMVISIPLDAGLNNELLEITYLTTRIPSIGTPLAIDYRYGFVFGDYDYIKDNLAVWYEYGDNAIDWSISGALEEGEEYFVSYKYGASREALRTNFGNLTNVPFFQDIPLTIDRELYRDGLKGTLQAFAKGPTIPAYEELVKSFTKIEPEIDELIFGSWILGRDYLTQGEINYGGVLDFKEGKFDQGLVYNDDVHTSIPAISAISLKEGTLDAWVRPEWAGINNDAVLTFDIDHIGQERVFLRESDDPFSAEFNWDLLPSSALAGGTDTLGSGVNIFNYRSDSSEQGGLDSGVYGLYKDLPNLTRLVDCDFTGRMRIGIFGNNINDLRKVFTETPEIITVCEDDSILDMFFIIGCHGPGDIVEGPWPKDILLDLSRTTVCGAKYGAGTFIVPDGERVAGVYLTLNEMLGFKFEVDSEDITSVTVEDIPKYNRMHTTRSCKCSITNRIPELEQFNELTMEIELGEAFDLRFFKSQYNIVEDSPEVMVITDTRGVFYPVVAFEDTSGNVVTDSIPDVVNKVIVRRFGINNTALSAKGSEAINALLPDGIIKMFYKSVEIFTRSRYTDSVSVFDFKKVHILDWQKYHDYRIVRNPLDNLVDIYIDNNKFTMFYSDLFYACNLTIWLRISYLDFRGVAVGIMSNKLMSNLEVSRITGSLWNRFDFDDIHIGRNGYHPKKMPFEIDRNDYPNVAVGMPPEADTGEGVYIWYDELCQSPLSSDVGQWVFRTRAARTVDVPTGVIISGDSYTNVTSPYISTHTFSGEVLTDGEFGSVERATRDETTGGCTVGTVCDVSFRYCGNDLLEDLGWAKLDESDSDLVNTLVGGMETQYGSWRKHGEFDTSASQGVYRMGPSTSDADCVDDLNFLGNLVYTENPCPNGNFEFTNSLRVVDVDPSISSGITGTFSGTVSGSFTGITPLHINDGSMNIKLALAFSYTGENLVNIVDVESGRINDIISYVWNDNGFHEYSIEKDEDTGILQIFIDELLVSQINVSEFTTVTIDETSDFISPHLATYLLDADLVDPEIFITSFSPNIIDIDLLFFSGIDVIGAGYTESTDVIINTDSKINFTFNIDALDLDGYDGYDGYSYAVGVDEMFISSDKLRYLVDSGVSDGDRRLSVFKDGKGFLNFRVFDNSLEKNKESQMFNVATNIKHFKPGELHHIAASWKLNTIDEKDEMHIFIDGQEAPNIYKFGGRIPVKLSDKFSDVSKEVLHSFLVSDLEFCDTYTDGTVSAGSPIFRSASVGFTEDMIGRSILITGPTFASALIGEEFIIRSVIDSGQITLGRGSNIDIITFNISSSDLEFKFPPTSGIKAPVLTDLRNSRFAAIRTDLSGNVEEFGGILYTVSGGVIDVISGSNVIRPKFRANIDSRVIEFIGQDDLCNFIATVEPTDIDVHIETFGLNLERCRQKLQLSTSSYSTDDNIFSGLSVVRTQGTEPTSLGDVKITRVLLDKEVIELHDPQLLNDGNYQVDFTITIDNSDGIHTPTSETGEIQKRGLGRKVSLYFDSDVVDFCQFDGYDDGYISGELNTITVYGTTTDGTNEETFFVERNGEVHGSKFFKTIDSIEGALSVVDPDYFEAGIIGLRETDPISTSNNGGDSAEVFDYKNGHFVLTTVGSSGVFPFELHPGLYNLDYPSYLHINLPEIGHDMFIGSDFNKERQFGGVIDQFRIISEPSGDTRVTELTTSATRSVTSDYNSSIPACSTSQTLTLIPFNDPISLQSRRLRTKEFLDQDKNIKYNLTLAQREGLLQVVNDSNSFISKMINMGFSLDDATKTFYEVHRAEGGPIFNEANYYRNLVEFPHSDSSVNSNFGNSGNFTSGPGLIIKNDEGQFRKNEGSIEFWVSPTVDTTIDQHNRYYIDAYSIKRERILSKTSTIIDLPNAASEIIDIKLLENTQEFSEFYSESEKDRILFDEVSRNEITGRLDGGTGTGKNFGLGSTLSPNGRRVMLSESLPAFNTDVVVTYVPLDSNGDRITIFKNKFSQIVFAITADGVDNVVKIDVDWKRNTWHRVLCTYRTGSGFDTMRIFSDGSEGGFITYGSGIIYGTGYVYGQHWQGSGNFRTREFSIPLDDEFKLMAIGSDVFGDNSARSRMDNIRFSREMRSVSRDANGDFIDPNYSANINTVNPVVEDDITTLMVNFDEDGEKIDKFATIIDPENGIFNFDILIHDNFDRVIGISDGLVEDLIVDLVNRLKPAHSNAQIKFKKSRC